MRFQRVHKFILSGIISFTSFLYLTSDASDETEDFGGIIKTLEEYDFYKEFEKSAFSSNAFVRHPGFYVIKTIKAKDGEYKYGKFSRFSELKNNEEVQRDLLKYLATSDNYPIMGFLCTEIGNPHEINDDLIFDYKLIYKSCEIFFDRLEKSKETDKWKYIYFLNVIFEKLYYNKDLNRLIIEKFDSGLQFDDFVDDTKLQYQLSIFLCRYIDFQNNKVKQLYEEQKQRAKESQNNEDENKK